MKAPFVSLHRRSLLMGGALTGAASLAACAGFRIPPEPKQDESCHFDDEFPIARYEQNCLLPKDVPRDLAWHLRKMCVPEAWKISPKRGKGILIGHIDTGVAKHLAFTVDGMSYQGGGILWERGYDFIDNIPGGYDPLINNFAYLEQIGHGTATASVIVGRGQITDDLPGPAPWESQIPRRRRPDDPGPKQPTDSELMPYDRPDETTTRNTICGGTTGPGRIAGVAPAADLVPVRAFRLAATRDLSLIAVAVRYLIRQKVHVITMALGWLFHDRELENAIQEAINAGIVVLAAAGNFVTYVTSPARGAAIAIGGVGPDDKAWCGSSRGPQVAVSAYADKVWRAYRNEKTPRDDLISPRFGTSFAVSMTAGVAALWLAHRGPQELRALAASMSTDQRKITQQELFRAALIGSATKPAGWERENGELGAGIVNAKRLLELCTDDLRELPTKTRAP